LLKKKTTVNDAIYQLTVNAFKISSNSQRFIAVTKKLKVDLLHVFILFSHIYHFFSNMKT